jgi:hypothetical protein
MTAILHQHKIKFDGQQQGTRMKKKHNKVIKKLTSHSAKRISILSKVESIPVFHSFLPTYSI